MKKKAKKSIPADFQPILWSANVKKLDLEKDKIYIIHQILSYGDLDQIKWLFKVYKKEEIRKVFLKSPKNLYIPAVFYFVKNFILDLRDKRLKEEKYVKNLF